MSNSNYMKRYLLLTTAVLAAGSLTAQEADSLEHQKDTVIVKTTRVEISGDGIELTFGERDQDKNEDTDEKKKEKDVFDFGILGGFDLGFNAFMVNGDLNLAPEMEDFEQKLGNSTNVQIRFLNLKFRPADFVEMNFALGLDYNDWALENDVTLQPEQEYVTFTEEPIHFTKNKFKAKYLTLPFNLQLVTFNKVTFTGGFEPQFLLRGRMKQRSQEEGKTKVDDNFNLREFRYAWVGRVGYDGFSVFCRYYPKSIFADGEGPEIQNISFGIGWGF
ncbi:outer membrane protein with beta-barrel domain [Anseongella ginsenosidimutans]|uniref:Outer membrane protein with beta-barrel domain n=2 Tax=Anseongella ginsenosidimutans TaxID=496056 RepID=A0A4R3KJR7_9SPHI|nr:outer membrane protein with beta-barrel domain [Anseongella ginsenosidimutans]